MRCFFIALTLFLSIACTTSQTSQNNVNLAEKNKETALKNELKRTVRMAQEVEKDGRALDYLRNSYFPEDKKNCQASSAEKRVSFEDFKTKVEKLPDPYREKLSTLFEDLDKCFNCDKKAVESCKKSRAAINQIIRELFPE
jgi:hypothetical protein